MNAKALEENGWFCPNLLLLYIIICFCAVIQRLDSVFAVGFFCTHACDAECKTPMEHHPQVSERTSYTHYNTSQFAILSPLWTHSMCVHVLYFLFLFHNWNKQEFIHCVFYMRMCMVLFFWYSYTNATTFTLCHNFHWNGKNGRKWEKESCVCARRTHSFAKMCHTAIVSL